MLSNEELDALSLAICLPSFFGNAGATLELQIDRVVSDGFESFGVNLISILSVSI